MFNSIKSIAGGVITIIILGLINQLILIMSLVGYGSLTESYPLLASWSQVFTYVLGAAGYFLVMLCGGLVTARLAAKNTYQKAIIASIIGSSFSLSVSLKDEFFTAIALFFIIFGVLSSIFGCWLWHRYQTTDATE